MTAVHAKPSNQVNSIVGSPTPTIPQASRTVRIFRICPYGFGKTRTGSPPSTPNASSGREIELPQPRHASARSAFSATPELEDGELASPSALDPPRASAGKRSRTREWRSSALTPQAEKLAPQLHVDFA